MLCRTARTVRSTEPTLDWIFSSSQTEQAWILLQTKQVEKARRKGGTRDSNVRVCSSRNETDITKVRGSKSLFLGPGGKKRG